MLKTILRSSYKPKTVFARKLRKDMTPGEIILWSKLRNHRFHGLKFRRQVPIGPFIVDFLCVEKALIIEIDGDSHFEEGAKERDQSREVFLRKQGFTILRFLNSETVCDINHVLENIAHLMGYAEKDI